MNILRILTPLTHHTGRAGIVELAAAEVLLEQGGVGTITIMIAMKIAVAGVMISTGAHKLTPTEVCFKGRCITAIRVVVTVKVSINNMHCSSDKWHYVNQARNYTE